MAVQPGRRLVRLLQQRITGTWLREGLIVFTKLELKGAILNRIVKIVLALFFVFMFRFGFGLFSTLTLTHEDARQTYLIGLKAYTTHTWPYFGTDTGDSAEGAFKAQCPGALEGLLIAGALFVWPNPAAPYVLVNLLSFLALALLAWYCHLRLPRLSPWFIFTWIFICPWTTHVSTQVLNLGLLPVGSVLFLIGFMESIPPLSGRALPLKWANAFMGFGVFWIMQLHMSWPIFLVLALVSFFFQMISEASGPWTRVYRDQGHHGSGRHLFSLAARFENIHFTNILMNLSAVPFFLLGALPMLALVAPTYLQYGFLKTHDVSGLLVFFSFDHFISYFTILARFFSFASFEMPRFLGDHTPERLAFLSGAPWLWPPAVFLLVAGWLQAIAMLIFWFLKHHSQSEWKAVKIMTLGVTVLIWVSFWFTVRGPDAHRYYTFFPFAMIYSLYCWDFLAGSKMWKRFAVVFIAVAILFQAGYAIEMGRQGNSSYLLDREKISQAIDAKDYQLLGERQPYSFY
jgi:hypothetical protein